MLSVICPVGPGDISLEYLPLWANDCNGENIELIVVLDKTSQKNTELIRHSLGRISNSQLLEVNVGSPGMARNMGLEKASGEWIAFWDSDDFPQVKQFLAFVSEVEDSREKLGCGNFEVIKDQETEFPIHREEGHRNSPLATKLINPGIWRFCFNSEILKGLKFSDSRMGEDQEFLAKILMRYETYISNRTVYLYRENSPNQLTSNKSNLVDLPKSLESIWNSYVLSEVKRKTEIAVLVIKMSLTGLLKSNRKIALRVLRMGTKNLIKLKPHDLVYLSKAMLIVIKGSI